MTSTAEEKRPLWKRLELFDWLAVGSIFLLSFSLSIIGVRGEQIPLRVSRFSWEGKKVGVNDRLFTLTFNRPVNRQSVEQNLAIKPPLAGKISWQGQKLTYRLDDPPIYGTNYQIQLKNARRSYDNQPIESFVSLLSTRDRAFAYIGIEGEERGRLIVCNITDISQPRKTILTPSDLTVTDFQIYPNSDKILFSAVESSSRQGLAEQQLYTVTTGLTLMPDSARHQSAGRLERILDAAEYQNLAFDLSDNGKTMIVWRVRHSNRADSSLWLVLEGNPPKPLGLPGGEFTLSPDGNRLVVSQQGGVGIIPLVPEAGSSVFLAGYEKSLGFSQDGKRILLVKNNQDYTRSLVLLNSKGETKVLFRTLQPIRECAFELRDEKILYCLRTEIISEENGQYREEPFLSAIDLATNAELPLLALPNNQDVQLSMSPDGVALLFDQIVTTPPNPSLQTGGQQAIADGQLWLLPLPELKGPLATITIQPQEITPGYKPQWLP